MAVLDFSKEDLDKASQLLHGKGITWEVMFANVYMAEDRARVVNVLIADKHSEYLQEIGEQLSRIEYNTRGD